MGQYAQFLVARWRWAGKGSGAICGWVSLIIGAIAALLLWLSPKWTHDHVSDTMNVLLVGLVPLIAGASVFLVRWILSSFFVYQNEKTEGAATIAVLGRRIDELTTLPQNPINVAMSRLRKLTKEGETMKRKLEKDQQPVPTEKEVQEWGARLIDLVQNCGTLTEHNRMQAAYHHLGFVDAVLIDLSCKKEYWNRAKEIGAKLIEARAIMARLIREDMVKNL